ncbi:MAG: CBS domain-containing protein [Acidobacteriota bacterium]|nr:CBS domain-containing protein [Acidobacteriota bacterium]
MGALKLAQDVMVTKLVTVSPQTEIFAGIRTLLDHGITGAPVDGQVSRRDVLRAERTPTEV